MITKREKEIMDMLSRGYSSLEVSQQLFISQHTVQSHKKNLFIKLHVNNCAELVRRGFEKGYLSIDNPVSKPFYSNMLKVS